jgi:hypothetical protein
MSRSCSVRLATSSFAGVALLLCSSLAYALGPNTQNAFDIDAVSAEKWSADRGGGVPNPIYINVGGDTIGSATVIGGVPYADGGNTCQFAHDYDEICPYNLPGASDVVYSLTPAADIGVTISICNSVYDTKLYVYENAVGNLVGCNDDVCGSDSFKSELECVSLSAGNTYYIVIDGWSSTDCGTYELVVSECVPCVVTCPAGGVLEGEEDCQDDTLDSYNGGCNSNPPAFSGIPCPPPGQSSTTMCGTYGGFTYFGLSYRDTDWYSTTLIAQSNISFCVNGELDSLVGIIDGNAGCPVSFFYDYTFGSPCVTACLNQTLPAGEWWFFVATSGFGPTAGPCGSNYTATLTGAIKDCPVSVEPATWGSIKNLYR